MLTTFLIKTFIPNWENTNNSSVRSGYGVLSAYVGIGCNLLLFVLKLIMGFLSASIAVIADAFNNLSDAGSSLITLFGFKLAQLPADDDHPFGHGRFEYISGLAIAFLILLVGYQFFTESVQKIFDPQPTFLSTIVVVSLVASIGIKFWMSHFYGSLGKTIDSSALMASAADSKNDVFGTLVALISILLSPYTSLPLDGILGACVAIFIFVNGIGVAKETIDPLLGNAPSPALVSSIENAILTFEDIIGVHDLMVHDYGPGRIFASAHAEVSASGDLIALHDTVDLAEKTISQDFKISLVLHMDPVALDCPETLHCKILAQNVITSLDPSLQLHDFRRVPGVTHTNLVFDMVVPYQYPVDDKALRKLVDARLKEADPTLHAVITIDRCFATQS